MGRYDHLPKVCGVGPPDIHDPGLCLIDRPTRGGMHAAPCRFGVWKDRKFAVELDDGTIVQGTKIFDYTYWAHGEERSPGQVVTPCRC